MSSDTARELEQMFSLNQDPMGELEYPTKYHVDPGAWGLWGTAPPERRRRTVSSLLPCHPILGSC